MKLSTKALLSSLVAARINTQDHQQLFTQRRERRYEKVLEKHDRKGELRAGVLGIAPYIFRREERYRSLLEIVKERGFKSEREFYVALVGKIRDELKRRGWALERIDTLVQARLLRLTGAAPA